MRLHEAVIQKTQRDRLIGHIARDSPAIEARERYPDTPRTLPKKKRCRKGPKAKRSLPSAPRSHSGEELACSLGGAPDTESVLRWSSKIDARIAVFGVNKSSKGHRSYWRGYKLHLDVAGGEI